MKSDEIREQAQMFVTFPDYCVEHHLAQAYLDALAVLEKIVTDCDDCRGKGYEWAYGERTEEPVKVECTTCKPIRDFLQGGEQNG